MSEQLPNDNKHVQYEAKDTVGMVLMGSEEAEAAVQMLREQRPDLTITYTDCFYSIDGRGKIEIDLAELSDRMGREITVQDFLVVFSTFYGRINMDEKCFGVYADMLGLEDPK